MKKPKIRFKGYQEDWEQRKFADFTWDAGKRNKEDLDLEPYAITNEHGFIRQRDAHDDFGYMKDTDRKAYNIVQPNSFAYNPARINVGSIGYYKGVENVIVSSLYEVFQTDNYVNDRFLWHWLKSDEFPRWIAKLQEGSVRLYFYYDKLCECQLYMPSLEEQEKIATFLDDLDHLITLHHRKYMKYADLSVFDWEQRKLGELGSLKNGMNFSKEAMGIGFPFVNLQNIFGNNVIDVTNLGKAMASDSQLKDYNLLNGDVLFVRSSVKLEGVGEAALVPQNLENTTYSGFIIRFRDEYGLDNNFKRFLFGIESVRNQIMAQATNSANKNISQTVLENLCLKIPNKSEQEKIGLYFSNLDHLITLHQRKCEETKTLKKYMLQKMFPQNGHSVPEIRFSGFTEDWEQRKLVDLVDRVTRKNQDLVSELPLTISAQYGLIDQNEFFDKRVASKDVSGYYLIENGEFAYNKSTSTDAPWGAIKRLDRYKNGVLSTLYIVFGIKENNPVDSDFLVSYYSTNLWHKGIHEIAAEGARNHGLLNIAPADFFETKLMIPQDIEEQKKIGKYFEELERLITLHQHKCEELQNIKKFMLKNMFI